MLKRTILIAEDDQDDQLLLKEALVENSVPESDIHFVSNGLELIQELIKQPDKPRLVLLDLNMPKKDGRQALKEIKNSNVLRHIPIIIFSTSTDAEDIIESYKEGTNTYFSKPSSFKDLVEVIGIIKTYWLDKAAVEAA